MTLKAKYFLKKNPRIQTEGGFVAPISLFLQPQSRVGPTTTSALTETLGNCPISHLKHFHPSIGITPLFYTHIFEMKGELDQVTSIQSGSGSIFYDCSFDTRGGDINISGR